MAKTGDVPGVGESLNVEVLGSFKDFSFEDVYRLGEEITSFNNGESSGGSGNSLHKAAHLASPDDMVYSVKVLDRINPEFDEAVLNTEVKILNDIRVADIRNVIHIADFYTDKAKMYIVLNLPDGGGGRLFDRLSRQSQFSERDARMVVKVLLKIVQNLHSLRIVHRDLKPDNFVMKQKNDGTIVLFDFGHAKHLPDKHRLTTKFCGSAPAFTAPEILDLEVEYYSTEVDMWSVGCLMFFVLSGTKPFSGSASELLHAVTTANFHFDLPIWETISPEAKELISNLLVLDQHKRYTTQQAMESAWFELPAAQLVQVDLAPSLQRIKKSYDKQKLNAATKNARLNRPSLNSKGLKAIVDMSDSESSDASSTKKKSITSSQRSKSSAKSSEKKATKKNKKDKGKDKDKDATKTAKKKVKQKKEKNATATTATDKRASKLIPKNPFKTKAPVKQQPKIQLPMPGDSLKMEPLGSFKFPIEKIYRFHEEISSGTNSILYSASHISDPEEAYAVKIVGKSDEKDVEKYMYEVSMLKEISMQEQNIKIQYQVANLIDFYMDNDKMYMVQQLANGGDLYNHFIHRETYTEHEARNFAKGLLLSVQCLHNQLKIVHRNITPENILIKKSREDDDDDDDGDDSHSNEGGNILLCDFGCAKKLPKDTKSGLKTLCGTAAYTAPEMINHVQYREEADMWSIGCVIFLLLGGYQPYQGKNDIDTYKRIKSGQQKLKKKKSKSWDSVTKEAKALVSNLLTLDTKKRYNVNQALACDWFDGKKMNANDKLKSIDLSGSLKGVQTHSGCRKLRAAVHILNLTLTESLPEQQPEEPEKKEPIKKKTKKKKKKAAPDEDNNKNNHDDDRTNKSKDKAAIGESLKVTPLGSYQFPFNELYTLDDEIGFGSRSIVYKAHTFSSMENEEKTYYAVKVAEKTSKIKDDAFINEVSILKSISDIDQVTKIIDFFMDDTKMYMVLELAKGGDLLDRIANRKIYTECDVRQIFAKLLISIGTLYKRKLVHRNIKPDSILLKEENESLSQVILCDFSLAKYLPENGSGELSTVLDPSCFIAPEIISGQKYRQEVDLWSAGCVLYFLLSGVEPFVGENIDETCKLIAKGDYDFNDRIWDTVSKDAKTLVSKLLTIDPKNRWTVSQAVKCDWFAKDSKKLKEILLNDSQDVIKKARVSEKMRAAASVAKLSDTSAHSLRVPEADEEEDNDDDEEFNNDAILPATSSTSNTEPIPDREQPQIGESLSTDPLGSLKYPFVHVYYLHEKIGSGSLSVVYRAQRVSSNDNETGFYAVKVVNRRGGCYDEDYIAEASILKDLRDIPHVTTVVDFYMDENKMYMVQELAEGGDAFDRLYKQKFTEAQSKDLFRNVLVCIESLHTRGVVHRDLKLENVLLKSRDNNPQVLLCDFGYAAYLPDDKEKGLSSNCGTPAFVAPEIVNGEEYREKVDMWSAGCLIYMLLCGLKPFEGANDFETYSLIVEGSYEFGDASWNGVSQEAKDVVSQLLTLDAKKRLSAAETLKCDWLLDGKPKKRKVKRKPARKKSSMGKGPKKHKILPKLGESLDADPLGSIDFPFNKLYHLDEQIGGGHNSVVCKAHPISNPDDYYAVKIVNKGGAGDDAAFVHETFMLKNLLKVANVTTVIDFYIDKKKMYLVQELAEGGDLYDRFAKKEKYFEKDARELVKKVLVAAESLHARRIVHRDIKMENILFKGNYENSAILFCDFEYAKHLPDGDAGLQTHCGTPEFTAPEIINGIEYREQVDMWSIGCLIYLLLGGREPFKGANDAETYEYISRADYAFDGSSFEEVSAEAKELISNLLTLDATARWTATQALDCDWLYDLANADLTQTLGALNTYSKTQKIKTAEKISKSGASHPAQNWNATNGDILIPKRGESLNVDPLGSLNFPFKKLYGLDEQIGSGTFSVVCKVHLLTNPDEFYAVKIVNRSSRSYDDAFLDETSLLKDLINLGHVTKLIDFYTDDSKMYLVQELAVGGDLFERFARRKNYTENDARSIAKRVLISVEALHNCRTVHRDVKPENILFKEDDDNSPLLLCDFGNSSKLPDDGEGLWTHCGTPEFTAPEIVNGEQYREEVDMWSVGCLIYWLVGGHHAFKGETDYETYELISEGDFIFDGESFDMVSKQVKDLISNLLTVDRSQRWTASQALKSDWFSGVENADLSKLLLPIKKESGCLKLKAAVKVAMPRPSLLPHPSQLLNDSIYQKLAHKPGESLDADPLGKVDYPLTELYHIDEEISVGSFSVICKAHLLANPDIVFAVKAVNKRSRSYDEAFVDEVTILKELRDLMFVTKAVDFFVDDDKMFFVQEYAEGGDMFNRIGKKKSFSENDARSLAKRMLVAIEALHNRGIAHRDIKPENFLFKSEGEDSDILLADFEFAKHLPEDGEGLWTHCGTPTFTAPEIVNGEQYREEVDMWSFGCLLFMVIGGYKPFRGEDEYETYELIIQGDYGFDGQAFGLVSSEAKDLISRLLLMDGKSRCSATQALKSAWFTSTSNADLTGSVRGINKYSGCRKLKAAVSVAKLASNPIFKHPTQTWGTNDVVRISSDVKITKEGNAVVKGYAATRQALKTNTKAVAPLPQKQNIEKINLNHVVRKKPETKKIAGMAYAPPWVLKVPFNDSYCLGKEIVCGKSSVVFQAHSLSDSGKKYAVKVVDRVSPSAEETYTLEAKFLRDLRDIPQVVNFIDFYVDDQKMYLVQEFVTGGNLLDHLYQLKSFNESEARDLFKILLQSVRVLHIAHVVHRNLSPENFLVGEENGKLSILLCDFGCAKRLPEGNVGLSTCCGDPLFTAPEIVNGLQYREEVDMWSVGCILYVMLGGYSPFEGTSDYQIYKKIAAGDYNFDSKNWKCVSNPAKKLITNLFIVDGKQRWTVSQALDCKWMASSGFKLKFNNLLASQDELRKWGAHRGV